MNSDKLDVFMNHAFAFEHIMDTKGPGINNPDYALKVLFFLKEEKEM